MTELLTRDDWRRLERLVLSARAATASPLPGRRTGTHRGYSVEFHDYRQYETGDDPRDIDWTIYARLDRLFLRLFRAESELTVHVLVDTSASMRLGGSARGRGGLTGSSRDREAGNGHISRSRDLPVASSRARARTDKLTFACKVASAIAYVVASNQERVGLATFAGGLQHVMEPRRGRAQAGRILQALGAVSAAGISDFRRSLQQYANLPGRRGLAIVITDAFSPEGVEAGLAYLSYRGFEVTLVHVLSDDEVSPALDDLVELVDVESGGAALTTDNTAIDAYRRELHAFTTRLETFCAARRMLYLRALSSTPFDAFVLQGLRSGLWQ